MSFVFTVVNTPGAMDPLVHLVQSLEKVAVPATLPHADAVGVTNRIRVLAAFAMVERKTAFVLLRCSGGVV
jgi:hypothetical protein